MPTKEELTKELKRLRKMQRAEDKTQRQIASVIGCGLLVAWTGSLLFTAVASIAGFFIGSYIDNKMNEK